MASVLSDPRFHDEAASYQYVEARIWPDGPVCPRCGTSERIGKLKGKSTRMNTYKCYECRKPFTVKVGTIFEASKVPMHIWLQAIHLLCAGKKGVSANELSRILGVQLRTAWFMAHRIREAMRPTKHPEIGGAGKAVEADETFFGRRKDKTKRRGYGHKHAVLALIERGGKVQSHHVPNVKASTLKPILYGQIRHDSMLMTDEAGQYRPLGKGFKWHFAVNHGAGEYVRGGAHTNTLENYFSIFKRGMKGVYQHCSQRHLRRYLAEFDFRYNERGVNDIMRAEAALTGVVGKRLKYMDSSGRAAGTR